MRFILLILLCIPFIAHANEWSGTVTRVIDGDTVIVQTENNEQIRIRLTEIDAPEKKQAFGEQSTLSLTALCLNKPVVIKDSGKDRYKRVLGRIFCDGVDANAWQVQKGLAWAYRKYLTDSTFIDLENTAKSTRQGLWIDDNPVAPWEFRHGNNKH